VSCGSHLLSLINDVLDLSKIEAGKLEIDEAPCDLSKLIRSVSDVVAQRARAQGVTFDTEVSPEVPQGIVTDEGKLRQILVNLLGNAVKFTTEGGVSLRVSESPKDRLRFDVVDTGVGMSEAEIAQIFDPFKQVEAGKASGGTGLGLSITQRLVERLGGRIEVASEEGEGSTFTVDLPLVEAPTQDFGAIEESGELDFGDAVLAPGQDCTVLVADDRETNRDILERMLDAAGITPIVVDDGDTALEALEAHDEIDLVLMDVRMPRLSGIEVVKRIRADSKLRDMKVIAVTASVFPEFREKAIEAGFDDFLGKPFLTEELIRKLEKHLGLEFVGPAGSAEKSPTDAAAEIPADRAAAVAARIREAVWLGNVTALGELASELRSEEVTEAGGRRIEELTRAFDFDGLERLAREIEDGARE
jgi:CheY-like chemotaxis protein